ncbi:MAG: acyltransferase [Bacteroidales bacterium]|nr:acyltransferase [Bacteroidales bacterium]
MNKFKNTIFNTNSTEKFNDAAIEIFHYQYQSNELYQEFVNHLKIKPSDIRSYNEIPFLPVGFFKTHKIKSNKKAAEIVFSSSGTSGSIPSKHYVTDISVYQYSFRNAFEYFFGDIKNYCVLALLPSYLEREGSSLVFMIDDLIKRSENSNSGFYLYNTHGLVKKIHEMEHQKQKVILFGVSFALLDLVEKYTINTPNAIIMETGGMKGRKKEIIRNELHRQLCDGFGVQSIQSEYGMTELLSQAYSKANGIYNTPPWMKILVRDINDPLSIIGNNKTGGINIIDLANYNSCSFIATQDLGKLHNNSSFEVLGRFDESDIRGCSLLVN